MLLEKADEKSMKNDLLACAPSKIMSRNSLTSCIIAKYHARVVSVIDADIHLMGLTLYKYVNSER